MPSLLCLIIFADAVPSARCAFPLYSPDLLTCWCQVAVLSLGSQVTKGNLGLMPKRSSWLNFPRLPRPRAPNPLQVASWPSASWAGRPQAKLSPEDREACLWLTHLGRQVLPASIPKPSRFYFLVESAPAGGESAGSPPRPCSLAFSLCAEASCLCPCAGLSPTPSHSQQPSWSPRQPQRSAGGWEAFHYRMH